MLVGGLATRLEGADEADVACHLGLTHVDIDLGAVHEQLGLIAGMPTSVTLYIRLTTPQR